MRTFHPVMAQVLYNRGYDTPEKARVFLEGGDDALHGPFALRGMNKAVARIRKAIRSGETIAVYGDFDADGVTSTAFSPRHWERLAGRRSLISPIASMRGMA